MWGRHWELALRLCLTSCCVPGKANIDLLSHFCSFGAWDLITVSSGHLRSKTSRLLEALSVIKSTCILLHSNQQFFCCRCCGAVVWGITSHQLPLSIDFLGSPVRGEGICYYITGAGKQRAMAFLSLIAMDWWVSAAEFPSGLWLCILQLHLPYCEVSRCCHFQWCINDEYISSQHANKQPYLSSSSYWKARGCTLLLIQLWGMELSEGKCWGENLGCIKSSMASRVGEVILPLCSAMWDLTCSTASRWGVLSTGETQTCRGGIREGPHEWSKGWNTSHTRTGWEIWGCSAWRRLWGVLIVGGL